MSNSFITPNVAFDFTTAILDSRITFTRPLASATRVNSSGNPAAGIPLFGGAVEILRFPAGWYFSGVAGAANPEQVLRRMLAQRLRFVAGLPNWPAFGRGWARRIADVMET